MRVTRGLAALVLLVALGLTGCGGGPVKADCNTDARYLSVVDGKRVIAPEGLDDLDSISEMPIPRSDPEAEPVPPGRCVDMPPTVISGNG